MNHNAHLRMYKLTLAFFRISGLYFNMTLDFFTIFTAETKFAKVMFLLLSGSHSVHKKGGVPGPVTPPGQVNTPLGPVTPPRTRYTPWAGTPPGPGTPPGLGASPGQVHLPRTRYTPWAGTPPGTRYTPQAGTPPSSACWEIRATSGRYASYWNAFLYIFSLSLMCH